MILFLGFFLAVCGLFEKSFWHGVALIAIGGAFMVAGRLMEGDD